MLRMTLESHPLVPPGVVLDDLGGPVGAGVVAEDVLPVRVRLGEHPVDAFGYVAGAVVDGRDDAYQRLGSFVHLSSGWPLSQARRLG